MSAKTQTGFDQITETMTAASEWAGKNAKLIVGVAVVLFVIGAGVAITSQVSQSREEAYQEKYFVLEKRMTDIKKNFDEAEQQEKAQAAAAKAGKAVDTKNTVKAKATGDLAKDYGTLPGDFEALIKDAPNSKAAEMAALNLSDLRANYGQADEALKVIDAVNVSNRTSDFVGALVVNRRAQLLADKGDCKGALDLWGKIVADSRAKFLHDESKVRMGLCYESTQDLAKAEQMYTEVSTKEPKTRDNESVAAKDADRYLRLLRLKKATRGS